MKTHGQKTITTHYRVFVHLEANILNLVLAPTPFGGRVHGNFVAVQLTKNIRLQSADLTELNFLQGACL